MDSRFAFTRSRAQDAFSNPRRSGLDSGFVTMRTTAEMSLTGSGKFNEKEQMHGLNDRLAGFIDKVHQLEVQNQLLEREIGELRGKGKPAACLEDEYGPELLKLRQLVQEISQQKHQIEIEHQNLEEELSSLRKKHEKETRGRCEAEKNLMVIKKDMNDAYRAKLQLDKKAQSLVDEIQFLKKNHEEEVAEMCNQIQEAQVNQTDYEFGHPDVTAALRDIRTQLEGHTVSDVQQIEETFRSQFAKLTEAAEAKREALKASQQEIQEYRRRLQAKSIELEGAKGTREALEKQLHDVEDRHNEELIHYQNTIKELENELINCKFDMSGYLREYQDLLNVKMALDVEIMSYRKLLCGEEARLSTMSDSHISLPHIYHQSPIYTLPCFSRPGGPHRRVEPQYKFVEEIITETTREIEMSEFEETGSEETEPGKDEQESTKSEKGSSKEEDSHKDTREDDRNQVCDSQQDQIGSAGQQEDGEDERDGESPGEEDPQENKAKDESEETEVVRQDEDNKTESKDSLSVDKDGVKNAKEEEAAEMKPKDQSDEKREIKPEVPEKPENKKEQSAEGEKITQVQPADKQKLSQEPKEPEKHLATKTTEKTEKTSKETEKVEKTETSPGSPKNEQNEPKEIIKPDLKKEEAKEVKAMKDVPQESKIDQHILSSLQSAGVRVPEVNGQPTQEDDKTQTVQSATGKEKVTETKVTTQDVSEKSQIKIASGSETSKK